MSLADAELIRFTGPWIAAGFVATAILGLLLDVRGAILAFVAGVVAPALTYLPIASEASAIELVLGMLRTPLPFSLVGTGRLSPLVELTLDWWLGGAFGTAIAIYARRRHAA